MDAKKRKQTQRDFLSGKQNLILATNAFVCRTAAVGAEKPFARMKEKTNLGAVFLETAPMVAAPDNIESVTAAIQIKRVFSMTS